MQINAIRKFLPRSEITVVIDQRYFPLHSERSGYKLRRKMIQTSRKLADNTLPFNQLHHMNRKRLFPNTHTTYSRNPSSRHADCLQQGTQYIMSKNQNPILILDEDMIPFTWVSPEDLFGTGAKILFLPQERVVGKVKIKYPWPGLFFFDPRSTVENISISWDTEKIYGINLDTGGGMHYWFRQNSKLAKEIVGLSSGCWNYSDYLEIFPQDLYSFFELDKELGSGNQFCELYMNKFLHMRAASNWIGHDPEFANRRLKLFVDSINKLLGKRDM
jgi:hypothetical protein